MSLALNFNEAYLGELANAASQGNWLLLGPNGDHGHVKAVQRFDSQAFRSVMRNFAINPVAQTIGLPVYLGHPDSVDFANQAGHQDKTVYGRLKKLRVGELGLEGFVKWNDRGRELVNARPGQWRYSPRFRGVIPASPNEVTRPKLIASIGLTMRPNLPVPAIDFANEIFGEAASGSSQPTKQKKENAMMMKVIHYLIAAGYLQPGAEEKDIEAAVAKLCEDNKGMKAKLAEMAANPPEPATTVGPEGEGEGEETDMANERKAFALTVVEAAIEAGRLPVAKKEETLTELAELANTKPEGMSAVVSRLMATDMGMKKGAQAKGLNKRDASHQAQEVNLIDLANERYEQSAAKGEHKSWERCVKEVESEMDRKKPSNS